MNKTININLGGLPFILDDQAYNKLDKYLRAIKSHFSSYDSYEEIMNDIESRVGELLQENVKNRLIINESDIDQIITIMGKPEDFGAEPLEDDFSANSQAATNEKTTSSGSGKYNTGKRLFRNTNGKWFAGVCNGLSSYFGVNVLLFRLAFIVLSFGAGVSIPIYILLWIFIPKAKTSADFLAMKGENASVSNIAEYLEKGFNRFSDEVNHMTDNISAKVKDSQLKERTNDFIQDLEDNIHSAWSNIKKVISPFLKIIGIILLLVFGFTWISMIIVFVAALPAIHFISSNSTIINFIAGLNSIVVFTVPLVFLVLWALRMLFKSNISTTLRKSLLVFWFTNLICLMVMGGLTANDYRFAYSESGNIPLNINNKDNVVLKLDKSDKQDMQMFFFRYNNSGDMVLENMPSLTIKKSEDSTWYLQKKLKSQGSSNEEARKNINCIEYNVASDNQSITFSDYITIKKDCKYRVQDVDLTLYIPVGATFRIQDDEVLWMLRDIPVNKKQMPNGFNYNLKGKLYRMDEQGISCVDCSEEELNTVTYNGDQDNVDMDDLPADFTLQMNDKTDDINIDLSKEIRISLNKIAPAKQELTRDNIRINIRNSPTGKMQVEQKLKYYSKAALNADQLANSYKVKIFNNEMVLSNVYELPAGNMNSEMEITILIPDKTKVQFDDSINAYTVDAQYQPENTYNANDLSNYHWEMTASGLKCLNCE